MKSTIDLPDELFQKVKILASERRTTLKELMIEALGHITRTPPEAQAKKRQAHTKRLLKAMQASNAKPMIPLAREEIYGTDPFLVKQTCRTGE